MTGIPKPATTFNAVEPRSADSLVFIVLVAFASFDWREIRTRQTGGSAATVYGPKYNGVIFNDYFWMIVDNTIVLEISKWGDEVEIPIHTFVMFFWGGGHWFGKRE